MNRRRIIAFLILAVVGSSLGLLAARVYGTGTDTGLTSMLRGVAECSKKKNAIECAHPIMRRAVEKGLARQLLDNMALEIPAAQCHYLGHVLGQELYRSRKSVEGVLGECSRACQGACVHGALGEAFTQAIGNTEGFDPEHINLTDIREKGKELCTAGNTCHGVGHALFQMLEDFDTSLKVCADIAPNGLKVHCYRGVFMEYADVSAERSVLSDVSQMELTIPELNSLCVRHSLDESRACFMYFPKMIEVALKDAGKKIGAIAYVRDFCESLSGEERLACVGGIGGYQSFQMFSDPDSVRRLCESFARIDEHATCAAGVSAAAAEHGERSKETFSFCNSFKEDMTAESCYRGIFDAYKIIGSAADAQTYCDADERCKRAGK